MTVHAILLAAGKSERMGTPKALLPWRKTTLGNYLVRTLLGGGASDVTVVVSAVLQDAFCEQENVRVVVNSFPERGMLSSVQVGMERIESGGALLILPCDLPLLTSEQVRAIIKGWDGAPEAIVAPTRNERRGHPTLFGPAHRESIRNLDPARYGLNQLLKNFTVTEISGNEDGPFRDADTPEAWAALSGRE